MLFSAEQAFVGKDDKRASLKTPVWVAIYGHRHDGISPSGVYINQVSLYFGAIFIGGVLDRGHSFIERSI